MARSARLVIALFVLLTSGGATSAEGSPSTTESGAALSLAWGGIARANRWTELRVITTDTRESALEIEAQIGPVVAILSGKPVRDRVDAYQLPLRLAPDAVGGDVGVVLRFSGAGERRLTLPLRWVGQAERVIAVAAQLGDAAAAIDIDGWSIIPSLGDRFPSDAESYSLLDAMVLDTAAIFRLSERQLGAVEQYLGGCGRLVLVAPSEAAQRSARSHAGCGASWIREIDDPSQLRGALAELLSREPPSLPDPRSLARVFSEPATAAFHLPLFAFFSVYVAALACFGLGLARDRTWLVVVLPLAASSILAASFFASPAAVKRYRYIEATSGSPVARYAELLRIGGAAPGTYTLTDRAAFGRPLTRSTANPDRYRVLPAAGASEAPRIETRVRTRLLSETVLYSSGALAFTPSLEIREVPDGPPVIANRGNAATPVATLLWKGEAYRVPGLLPGASFEISRETPLEGSQLPRWLAERRRLQERPVVIVSGPLETPVESSSLGIPPSEGWIVLHAQDLP